MVIPATSFDVLALLKVRAHIVQQLGSVDLTSNYAAQDPDRQTQHPDHPQQLPDPIRPIRDSIRANHRPNGADPIPMTPSQSKVPATPTHVM